MPFIAIEGVNGAGKSTVIENICRRFPGTLSVKSPMDGFMDALKDYFVRNPQSIVGRVTYFNTAMGYTSDIVRNALAEDPKRLVLTDRYWYTTEASHLSWDSVYNGSKDRHELLEVMDAAKQYLTKPDLVVLIEVDDKERLIRVGGRNDGRNDKWHRPENDAKLFNAFKEEYERIFASLKGENARIARINSTGINSEETTEAVIKEIRKIAPWLSEQKSGRSLSRR